MTETNSIEPFVKAVSRPLFDLCIAEGQPSIMYTRDASDEDNDFRIMNHAADGFLKGIEPELIDVKEWTSPFHGFTAIFRAFYGSDEYQFTYSVKGKSILDGLQHALLNHR